jgi:phage protein U
MRLGCLGDIVFEFSEQHANTFSELKRQRTWKYAEHDIIKGKARLQKLGRQLDAISLTGKFVDYFCSPLEELRRLTEEAEDKKDPLVLVLGDEAFGEFVIESIQDSWRETDGNGNPRVIEFEITLKEYY